MIPNLFSLMKNIQANTEHNREHVRQFSEANDQQHIRIFDIQQDNRSLLDEFDHSKQLLLDFS